MRLGVAIETWLLHMGPLEVPARSDGHWLIFEPVLPPKPWMPKAIIELERAIGSPVTSSKR
jgi:hypothetical protein